MLAPPDRATLARLQAPLPKHPDRATIDFETASVLDVTKVGAWLYSKHATTRPLCMAYHVPGMEREKLWHPAIPELGWKESPAPVELFEWIAKGGLVEAHNSFFEFCIWLHVMVARFKWPAIQFEQWRCSAAKAAACALPRKLEGAGAALGLNVRKDKRGKELIRKYCRPRRIGKREAKLMRALGEDPDVPQFIMDLGIKELFAYCRTDVNSEIELSKSIPDLSEMETQVWQITQRMNVRGLRIDTSLADAALMLAATAKRKLNAELLKLTGIEAGSQRAKVLKWLQDEEFLDIDNTKAKTVEHFIKRRQLSKRAKRVLQIVKEVNRTSPNKYKRMLESVDDDGRARDNLLYCGAERTGRFSGKGIQVHNLPKGKFAKGVNMDDACADVKTRNFDWCQMHHDDVMNLVVSCLRGAIISRPGRKIWSADYSAIEARCVLWEAGAHSALKVFDGGGDIYCDMASGIFNRLITKETAQVITALGATERDFGKVAVLGLGYGMGYLKFLITMRTYGIYFTRDEIVKMMGKKRFKKYMEFVTKRMFPKREDYNEERKFKNAEREASKNRRTLLEELEDPREVLHELALCKYTVDTYRTRYSEVPEMWDAQEAAAIACVRTRKPVKCGVVTWKLEGRFLRCYLPSGRALSYCDPEIKAARTSWGEVKPSLRFMGINQKTKQWTRQASYGGKLTENITQAIARDIMAHAKIAIWNHGQDPFALYEYELLLSVHDELLSETDDDDGDAEEYEALLCTLPAAYAGCPITAEAKSFTRYRK